MWKTQNVYHRISVDTLAMVECNAYHAIKLFNREFTDITPHDGRKMLAEQLGKTTILRQLRRPTVQPKDPIPRVIAACVGRRQWRCNCDAPVCNPTANELSMCPCWTGHMVKVSRVASGISPIKPPKQCKLSY